MDQEDLIPSSFDEFMNPQPEISKDEEEEKESIDERFSKDRLEWSTKVKEMSGKFKKVFDIVELQTEIYTERQRALEYYHYLISLLIKLDKNYKKAYADKYNFYTYQSQKRYPNETTLKNQIQSELEDLLEKREKFDNHSRFIEGVIKSIDNMIYGIKSRIEIEQISRGH